MKKMVEKTKKKEASKNRRKGNNKENNKENKGMCTLIICNCMYMALKVIKELMFYIVIKKLNCILNNMINIVL